MGLTKINQGENNHNIPAAVWFAVGLLDGSWSGGKVAVAVNVEMSLSAIHLVHILAERISKKNGYRAIDACFAYCPELDLFVPFASSTTAADAISELYKANKNAVIQAANQLIAESVQ